MSLPPGSRLGPYELTAAIGAGGMGEVYRARDPRLGRDVAIKTSKVAFDDRFQREARAIAALNHPNVCTLYDIGPDYLVMEYVDGHTLADLIRKGALPEAEALTIAAGIASAVEAAHEKGIVHRDLKPANIKITSGGQVKVLDFGLAKALGAEDSTPSSNLDSPTTAAPVMTARGLILGTPGYMAPEQARGQVVDKRADIWAFGVVLWEMLAGRRLFAGETSSDLVVAVLKEEPQWDAVPARVRPLLRRCLEKDPRKRLHDIADARLWLDDVPTAAVASPPTGVGRYAPWLLPVAVAAIVAATPWIWHGQPTVQPTNAFEFPFYAPPGASVTDATSGAAVSRDSRSVVFMGNSRSSAKQLYMHTFASGATSALPGTEGGDQPMWSPDGRFVAFLVGTKLKRLALSGGPSQDVSDVPPDAVSGFWENGFIVLGTGSGVWRFPERGGPGQSVTQVDEARGEIFHGSPETVYDGKQFIYFIQSLNANVRGLYLGSFDDPEKRRRLVATSNKGLFAPRRSGQPAALLYLRDDTLVAQSLETDRALLTGEPSIVVSSVRRARVLGAGQAPFWIASDGLLVYRRPDVSDSRPLTWISSEGNRLGEVAPPQGQFSSLFLSPDDTRVSVDLREPSGFHDVFIHDFFHRTWDKQTSDPANDFLAVWSPVGDRLVFGSSRTDGAQLYLTAPGSTREERITDGPLGKYPLQWTRDLLLFRGTDAAHPVGNLWALAVDGDREPFPVVQDQFAQFTGQISPDRKWIAYQSTKSGIDEIYLQKFQGTDPAIPISNRGGRWPKWRRTDGLELYYVSASDAMIAVSLTPSGDTLVPGAPRELFRSSFETSLTHPYDVTRDGKRFLTPERSSSAGRFDVMTNWRASVRR